MCFHTVEAAELAALLRASLREYARAVLYARKFIEELGNKPYLSDIVDVRVKAEMGAPRTQRLRVTIDRATDLLDAEDGAPHATSDPYCVCQVLGLQKQTSQTRFETPVARGGPDPVWDHSSVIHHFHPDQPLQFQVWGGRPFPMPAQLLGTAKLEGSEFLPGGFDGQLRLLGSHAAGSLCVRVEVLV